MYNEYPCTNVKVLEKICEMICQLGMFYVVEMWVVKGEWEIIVEIWGVFCKTFISNPSSTANTSRMGT